VLNVPGARLAGVLTALCAPATARDTLTVWRRDARHHPSPNAGVVEAAFAGSLGIRLGGANTYGDRAERRAFLGDGRAPAPADITRAVRLARRVGAAAAFVTAVLAAVLPDAVLPDAMPTPGK
jgi:adenosylcobinamide-phosphate synthase